MTTAAPITEKQADYIRSLCAEVRPDVPVNEEGLMSLSRREASKHIDALLSRRAELKVAAAVAKVEEDPQAAEAAADPSLREGYFTVQFGEEYDGEETHRTFRVRDAGSQSKLSGQRIISLLTGPQNTSDYMGVGFVTADGVKLWKRFASESVLVDAIRILEEDPGMAAKGYAMESGNCYVCGRLLTEPESIELGIGPVCRENGGAW